MSCHPDALPHVQRPFFKAGKAVALSRLPTLMTSQGSDTDTSIFNFS